MTLKEHIDDIRDRLKKGEFPNEAAVCDDIVRRLVHELGWPRYQSHIVYPQYSVEGGRVDFALCHPASKPRVFIEVKQVEKIEGAEEQLFRYAFQRGVPIAILTDGREWQFFYPTGEGTWAERKVCELDIITGESEENAEKLNRYLNYESIRTGEAVEAIKADYEKVVQQRQVATRLPEAWSKLVEEADELLLEVVVEKVESLCEHKPTNEQVLDFLKSLKRETESDRKVSRPPLAQQILEKDISTRGQTTRIPSPKQKAKAPPKRFIVIMPNGEAIEHPTSQATFVEALLKLIKMRGEEQVLSADKEGACISTTPLRDAVRPRWYGKYSISTNHGVPAKVKLLERITERLNVKLEMES